MKSLVEYLFTNISTSIDSLDIYSNMISARLDLRPQASCSQLQSLAINCPINDEGGDVPRWPRLGLFYIAPTLHSYHMGNLTNWSKLTHL